MQTVADEASISAAGSMQHKMAEAVSGQSVSQPASHPESILLDGEGQLQGHHCLQGPEQQVSVLLAEGLLPDPQQLAAEVPVEGRWHCHCPAGCCLQLMHQWTRWCTPALPSQTAVGLLSPQLG